MGRSNMTRQSLRRWTVAAIAAAAGASSMSVWLGDAGSAAAQPRAEAAKRKAFTVVDTVRLSLVRKDGNVLYERGTATGNLPGSVSARFVTSLTKVTGTVTFYPNSGGSITMTAIGYPTSTNRITGFNGNLAVSR